MFDKFKGIFYTDGVFVSDDNICYYKDIETGWCEFGELLEEKGDNKSIACGGYHVAVIKADNSVWAIGDNEDGQLGDGTNITRSYFIDSNMKAVSVTCENCNTAVTKKDGSVWTVGYARYGRFDDSTCDRRYSWIQVKKSLNIIEQDNLTESVNEYDRLTIIHKELLNKYVLINYKLENSILDSVDKEALIGYKSKIRLQLKDSQETLNAINELIIR